MPKKLTQEEYYRTRMDFNANPRNELIYTVHDNLLVTYGYMNDCNAQYCHDNNIPVVSYNRFGGCIVNCEGNITLSYCIKCMDKRRIEVDMLNEFVELLKEKGLKAIFDKNDVMVDGFKVASGVSLKLKPDFQWQIGEIQISLNQDIEVIRKVCKKKMMKKPKGLSEFGLTTDDIEDWINNNLAKYIEMYL